MNGQYQRVRARKQREVKDESSLAYELRALRRLIEREPMIADYNWNWEVTHYDGGKPVPLWFDALILVRIERSKKRVCAIDLKYYKSTDKYGKLRRARKQSWSEERGVPYLELNLNQMSIGLRLFCVKVRAGNV